VPYKDYQKQLAANRKSRLKAKLKDPEGFRRKRHEQHLLDIEKRRANPQLGNAFREKDARKQKERRDAIRAVTPYKVPRLDLPQEIKGASYKYPKIYRSWRGRTMKDRNPAKYRKELDASNVARNRRYSTEQGRAKRLAEKIALFDLFGGKCKCCGENELHLLTLDHVFNDGHQERKVIPQSALRRKILKGQISDLSRYQALCWNCNLGKRTAGGVCPHDIRRAAISLAVCAWISGNPFFNNEIFQPEPKPPQPFVGSKRIPL
jgi:hypothetical protein